VSRTNRRIVLGIGLALLLGIVGGAALLVRAFLIIADSNAAGASPIAIVDPLPALAEIVMTPTGVATEDGTISGLVYQDRNENGRYDNGESLIGSREVWLIEGRACHVRQSATATTYSGADGRYTFNGRFSGSYCVGLIGSDGLLEDVTAVTVTAGQVVSSVHLRALIPNGQVSSCPGRRP
jgi:hypothetical protein